MLENERKQKALELYNKIEKLVSALYQRWENEKEFEKLSDYSAPIIPEVSKMGGTFVKMTSKPFGFIYTLGGATYQIMIKRGTSYEYKRTA